MVKCPICAAPITSEEPYVILCGMKGEDICCCSKCEERIQTIMESDNASEVKAAINYFYGKLDSVADAEVKSFLTDMIENNAEIIDSIGKKPVQKKKDYFSDKEEKDQQEAEKNEYFWQNSITFVSWLAFILLLFAAVVLGVMTMQISFMQGILLMLVIGLAAFLSHAGIMVFIGMAEDIRRIRRRIDD